MPSPPEPRVPAQRSGGAPAGAFVDVVQATLEDLHQRFGLDMWMLTRRDGPDNVVLGVVDTAYGRETGSVYAWDDSFCSVMLAGEGPRIAPDIREVPAYRAVAQRTGMDVRAVVSIPVHAPDGALLGSLCGLARVAQPPRLRDAQVTIELQAALLGAALSHELQHGDDRRRVEAAERAAHTDPLTGVGNRRAWDTALAAEEARAARLAAPVGVVVVDLDQLKELNDAWGHEAGDRVLRRAAEVIAMVARPQDAVARLGGDEFGLLLPDSDLSATQTLVRRLEAALETAGIDASLGASARRAGRGLIEAWREADAGMYLRKDLRRRDRSVARGRPGAPAPDRDAEERAVGTAAVVERSEAIGALLAMAREQLGLEVAFVAQRGRGRWRLHTVDGVRADHAALAMGINGAAAYCQFALEGVLPPVVPDTSSHPALPELPVTRELPIGAWAGVPLVRANGDPFGALCAFSRAPRPDLREQDAGVLRIVGRMVMDVLEREEKAEGRRHVVLDRLDRLYAQGGPRPVFQPVRSLLGGQVVGMEALSRFPEGTPGPADWFAEAAAAGVGRKLEFTAVRAALSQLPAVPGFLSVNLSPEAICSPGFVRELRDVPLDRVVVEVTEHVPVEDYATLRAALDPLRADGLRIAVDDVGAGFASMRHVLDLVPDLLKLDIGLVRGIPEDGSRQALAAALVTFAGKTGARVIAEGIETAEEIVCLRELGVDLGQGYQLGRPAALESWHEGNPQAR